MDNEFVSAVVLLSSDRRNVGLVDSDDSNGSTRPEAIGCAEEEFSRVGLCLYLTNFAFA